MAPETGLQAYDLARSDCVVFDRSDQGTIEVVGREARFFLHNLCSNDIRNLPVGSWCEAFFTTATAKVVAYVKIACITEDLKGAVLQLEVAPGTAAKILKHLDHYLISEQVEFIDRTAELSRLHVAGPRALKVIAGLLPASIELPTPNHLIHAEISGVKTQIQRSDALGIPGFDLLFPTSQSTAIKEALTQIPEAGKDTYEILRIEAGTPAAEIDIDETTFAPEVGRQRQAISYTKGCYLGQEPIVMARDRGQVNRQLLGLKLTGDPVPHGSLVYREGKEIGRVTSSVRSPRFSRTLALAYIRRGNQEPGTLVEVEAAGQRQRAEVASLPFGA